MLKTLASQLVLYERVPIWMKIIDLTSYDHIISLHIEGKGDDTKINLPPFLTSLRLNCTGYTISNLNNSIPLKHLKLKNYPFEDLKIDNNLVSLEIVDASKIIELKDINTDCLEKVKLSFLKKLENIEFDCSKLTLLYIFDCKKISDLEKLLYSCVNLKELDVITYSIKGGIFNNLNFIKELKFLEYFGTNYRILDGNLKPLLALQEANISSYYRNYNLRDKELPHVTVCISEGTYGYRVRLDSLELGKEDPRITWLW